MSARNSSRWARLLRRTLATLLALALGGILVAWLWARDDARLTRLVNQQLEGVLQGEAHIGRVHWRVPTGILIEDVVVSAGPQGAPLARLGALSARLRLRPLLRLKLELAPTRVDGGQVWLEPGDAPGTLAWALQPRHPAPPKDEGAEAERPLAEVLAAALRAVPALDSGPIAVRGLQVVLDDAQGQLAARDIDIDVQASHDGDGHARASVTARVAQLHFVPAPGTQAAAAGAQTLVDLTLSAHDVAVRAEAGADAPLRVWAPELALRAPGIDVTADVAGTLERAGGVHATVSCAAGVTLDHAAWRAFLTPLQQRVLDPAGALQMGVQADVYGSLLASPMVQTGSVHLSVGGTGVRLAQVALGGATVALSLDATGEAQLAATALVDGSTLAARGRVQLEDGALTRHALAVRVADLSPAELFGKALPLVALVPALGPPLGQMRPQRAYLPEAVSLRLQLEGPRAWPEPRTQAALEAQAAGFRAAAIPRGASPVTATVVAALDGRALSIQQLDVDVGHNNVRLGLSASGRTDARGRLRLQLQGQAPGLGQLLAQVGSPVRTRRASVALDLGGSWSNIQGKGEILAYGIHVQLPSWRKGRSTIKDLGNLRIPLNFYGGTLFARGARLIGGLGKAGLTGFVRLLTREGKPLARHEMGGTLFVDGVALAALGEAIAPDSPQLAAGDTVRAHALLSGTLERPEALVHLEGRALGHRLGAWATLEDDRVALLPLNLMVAGGGQLHAEGSVAWRTGDVALRLHGGLPLPGAAGERAAALGVEGHLEGSLADVVAVALHAHTPAGRLELAGSMTPASRVLDIQLEADAALAELAQLVPALRAHAPSGHASARLHASGPIAEPSIGGTLETTDLALHHRPLAGGQVHVRVHTPEPGQYQLAARAPRALAADVALLTRGPGPWRVEADVSHFSAAALYPPLQAQGADVTGDASLRLRIGRRTGRPHGTLTVHHLAASSHGQALVLAEPAHVYIDGPDLGLSHTRLDGAPGTLTLEGHVGSVVRADAQAKLALAFVRPFVPALTDATGALALDVHVRGSRRDPQVHAALQVLEPVMLRPRGVPMEVRIAQGRLALSPEALSIERVTGGLEGGAFAMNGEVALLRFVPQRWDVQLQGVGLPVRADDLLLEANVALACVGQGRTPTLRGEVDILSGRYLRRLELHDFAFVSQPAPVQAPVAQRLPWLRELQLDVRAASRDPFDVQVDAGAFAVNTRIETDLHIGGNALAPLLTGKLQAPEGSLRFPRGDLRIAQAAVDFEPSRRSTQNPYGAEVNVRAEGEVMPAAMIDAQAYLVTLSLDGQPASLNLDLASADLNRLQVLSLLTTGHKDLEALLGDSNDESARAEAAMALAAFAGSQVAQSMGHFAQRKLEQTLNLHVDLAADVSGGNARVMAAKNLGRRFRLEGTYSHGLTQEQSNVSTRAQVALTDRLLLEGFAARDLTGHSVSATPDRNMQSNLELKYRLLGP